ncbi:MAG: hypothetical protein MI974_10015 [Chitinophagales bacterium]|nr:hypothetical protein [Chitinophagales bacterium]
MMSNSNEMLKSKTQFLLVLMMFGFFFGKTALAQEAPLNSKFEFDHIVIFSQNTTIEDSLQKSILTKGDKLTTTHKTQGTLGNYYIFYNTFIEFLYLNDTLAALKNERLFKSDYTSRWENDDPICPFGFGLRLSPFDTSQTSFPLTAYHSLDSPKDEYYLMSKFNVDNEQPLIYISSPQRGYISIDSLSEVDQIFDPHVSNDFKEYLTHPSEIKNLTKVVVTVPEDVSKENLELLSTLRDFEIREGKGYELFLIFDNAIQGKELFLKEPFELTIRY